MIFKELTLKVRKDGIVTTLEKSHLLLTNPLTSNYNFLELLDIQTGYAKIEELFKFQNNEIPRKYVCICYLATVNVYRISGYLGRR